MNKLPKIQVDKTEWGHEIVWGFTDNYLVKTIEISPNKKTPIYVHTHKEKNFIVVDGPLYFTFGDCCTDEELKTYKLPVGWSWYIEPKKLHRYIAMEKPARIIEVSSPELTDGMVLSDNGIDMERLKTFLAGEKKRGRPKGSKNKKDKGLQDERSG